jgi:hypothetical protein
MYFIIDNYFICLNKAIKDLFTLEYVLQIFKIKNYWQMHPKIQMYYRIVFLVHFSIFLSMEVQMKESFKAKNSLMLIK